MSSIIDKIANRHVARCLSQIEEVHALPAVCADAIRREIHYAAQDVAKALSDEGKAVIEDIDNRGNRRDYP